MEKKRNRKRVGTEKGKEKKDIMKKEEVGGKGGEKKKIR